MDLDDEGQGCLRRVLNAQCLRSSATGRVAARRSTTDCTSSSLEPCESHPELYDTLATLSRVEGVVVRAKSQEQLSERTQLAEALAQGRQLAQSLEEEGARRAADVEELQSALLQGRRRERLMASQLSQDLARATQVVRGQSGDWMDLALTIKEEVGTLARAIKADRDARAVESSTQRKELLRMIDNARKTQARSGVNSSGGSSVKSSTQNLVESGEELKSRAGTVVLRKMVDTTQVLLHNLEESLIRRAGFTAGIFHKWRCEVTLWKAGRHYSAEFARSQDKWEARAVHHRASFEEGIRQAAVDFTGFRDRVRRREELLLNSWARGESAGLLRQSLRTWHGFVVRLWGDRRVAAGVSAMCLQWADRARRGMLSACFVVWVHWTRAENVTQKCIVALAEAEQHHTQALVEERQKREQSIRECSARFALVKDCFEQGLLVVIARRAKDRCQELLSAIVFAWEHAWKRAAAGVRRSRAVRLSLRKCFEAGERGIGHWCFHCWKRELSLQSEQRHFEAMLAGQGADQELRHRQELEGLGRRVEAVKRSVVFAVDRGSLSHGWGLLMVALKTWGRHAFKRVGAARRCTSVGMSVARWATELNGSAVHGSFVRWRTVTLKEALQRKHEAQLQEEARTAKDALQAMLAGHKAELDSLKAKVARSQEAVGRTHTYLISRWEASRTAAAFEMLRAWQEVAVGLRRGEALRDSLRCALVALVEGLELASVRVCCVAWQGLLRSRNEHREWEEASECQREHFEGVCRNLERQHDRAVEDLMGKAEAWQLKALALSQASLVRWIAGEDRLLLCGVLLHWQRFADAECAGQARLEAARSHALRALAGEEQGLKRMVLVSWVTLGRAGSSHCSRAGELERHLQELSSLHEIQLCKYANRLGCEQKSLLEAWVWNLWKDAVQGARHARLEDETQAQLLALRRQHNLEAARERAAEAVAIRAVGVQHELLLALQVFEGWRLHLTNMRHEQADRLNYKQVLVQHAESMTMLKFQSDARSLVSSCLAGWQREGLLVKHERQQHDLRRKIEEHRLHSSHMEQRIAGMEEQLIVAYRQIDHIAETLQKELQLKENLTAELREANGRMRKAFAPIATTPESKANTTVGDSTLSSSLGFGSAWSQSTGSAPGSYSLRPGGVGGGKESSAPLLPDPPYDSEAAGSSPSRSVSDGRCDEGLSRSGCDGCCNDSGRAYAQDDLALRWQAASSA